MADVVVRLPKRSYRVKVRPGILSSVAETSSAFAESGKIALVFQDKVYRLYGARVIELCNARGLELSVHLVPDGEQAKSIKHLSRLFSEFAKARLDRKGLVVAIGGGAVGDLAGYAAASWLRGLSFLQVPTTLLAQVDASVGGKVAVNIPEGKNLVGAFWQPKCVLIDPNVLGTLPKRDLRSGLAEVIKYGIILDTEFYQFIKQSRAKLLSLDPGAMSEAILGSCELKAEVVSKDETETGLRAVLNFGHTFGHAVEAAAGYTRIRHGEAVAIGMVVASELAVRIGMFDRQSALDITDTIGDFGLPTRVDPSLNIETMMQAMAVDKKAGAGGVRFILPTEIGRVELVSGINPSMIKQVIQDSQAGA